MSGRHSQRKHDATLSLAVTTMSLLGLSLAGCGSRACPDGSAGGAGSASSMTMTGTAPPPRTVMVVAYPLDAEVRRGDALVGTSPVQLTFAANETAQITVQRQGYAPKTFGVDATQPRVEVVLSVYSPGPPSTTAMPTTAMPTTAPSAAGTSQARGSASACPPCPVCTEMPKPAADKKCPPGYVTIYGKCEHI